MNLQEYISFHVMSYVLSIVQPVVKKPDNSGSVLTVNFKTVAWCDYKVHGKTQ